MFIQDNLHNIDGVRACRVDTVLRFVRGMLYAWVMVFRDRGGAREGGARIDGVFVKACRAFLLNISLKSEKTKSAPCVPLGELN